MANSIALGTEALEVFSREESPVEWAQTIHNQAVAYSDYVIGGHANNIENAIRYSELVSEVFLKEFYPIEWANTQRNLIKAYSLRMYDARMDNLNKAIAGGKAAIEIFQAKCMYTEMALTKRDLATTLKNLNNERFEQNIEDAIHTYRESLDIIQKHLMPKEWADTVYLLANAYRIRIRGTHKENIESTYAHFRSALEVVSIDNFPRDYLRVQHEFGTCCFNEADWQNATIAYKAVLDAGNQLYQVAATPEARRFELKMIRSVPAALAYAYARQHKDHDSEVPTSLVWDGLLALETNRARWLSEELALRVDQPPGVPDALWQRFDEQRQTVQELQREAQLPDNTPGKRAFLTLSPLLSAARRALEESIAAIQAIAPDFMPQPTIDDVQATATETPLAYLLTTEQGGLALLLYQGQVTPVWLELTEEGLRAMLVAWFEAYGERRSNEQRWLDVMDETLGQLWTQVMGPLTGALRGLGVAEVTLIPTGLLSLLPLHAAHSPSPNLGEGPGMGAAARHYFMDEFAVAYAPSGRALAHSRAVAAATGSASGSVARLLAVDEPTVRGAGKLPNSAAEVDAIAEHFAEPTIFRHAGATRQAVLGALADAQVLHFSCHGANNWQTPLESGLWLAAANSDAGEMLTVRDFLEQRLSGARLASLSACETGIVGTELPDEVVALPTALVQAGVAGVVASLWSVADISTAMLMARFYELWRAEGQEPVHALRAAQLWMRKTTNGEKQAYFAQHFAPFESSTSERMADMIAAEFFTKIALIEDGADARSFEHPYWWAAFYLTGA